MTKFKATQEQIRANLELLSNTETKQNRSKENNKTSHRSDKNSSFLMWFTAAVTIIVLTMFYLNLNRQIKESKKELVKESQFETSKRISESTTQQMSSGKLLEKYPNAKLLGKTINNHLVFEFEDKKIKVSPKGGYSIL